MHSIKRLVNFIFCRPVGFDIHVGERLLAKGDVCGPAELGLLSSAACTKVYFSFYRVFSELFLILLF